ncbi:MAG TPA: GNAT family N-acetyltransferase [Acidimicrobiales bacterium]|nr:GNAT family N-acetyltransferase [Acidimicrobiales bacterium]
MSDPGDRVMGAAITTGEGGILLPFLLRPLAALEWVDRSDLWDATGPRWGYTGPFCWGDGAGLADRFWDEWTTWARVQHVVSSFTRLSLFTDDLLSWPGPRRLIQENVVRSTDLSPEELWQSVEHKVRKNVTRARREGVVVERVEPDEGALVEFLQVYGHTMQRRSAAAEFRYDLPFLVRLMEHLRTASALFLARADGRTVSAEIVLHSPRHAYSFIGGTLEEAFPIRPNDLLKFEIFLWAREQGLADVVLGGGPTPGDGIFRYKRSFAPQGVVPFYAGEMILDQDLYASLVEQRRHHDSALGAAWAPTPGFFPLYRS